MSARADAAENPCGYPFFPALLLTLIRKAIITSLLASSVAICVASASFAQRSQPVGISMPTGQRVTSSTWWPTKGDAARESYVGTAVCASCHGQKVASQQANAMAHAAVRAGDADVLRQHDSLSFRVGPYREEIATKGGKSILTVSSDNSAPISVELLWAFGVGHMGQTYMYERNGRYYESHLSFFASSKGLNITPGQSTETPGSVEDAAGRSMTPDDSRRCFTCHTTGSVTKNEFDAIGATLGVTCEACHGPGAAHAAAMKSDGPQQGGQTIMNPKNLDPVESVDFCGACHRTWEDVVTSGFTRIGTANARFAPYRLENSKCWRNPDARLACVACHDPHQALEHDPAAYDSRCLQCHINQRGAKTTADHPGAACRVSTKNCTTCHMPKIESPSQHSTFTDHWIRIVRAGKPYPN